MQSYKVKIIHIDGAVIVSGLPNLLRRFKVLDSLREAFTYLNSLDVSLTCINVESSQNE